MPTMMDTDEVEDSAVILVKSKDKPVKSQLPLSPSVEEMHCGSSGQQPLCLTPTLSELDSHRIKCTKSKRSLCKVITGKIETPRKKSCSISPAEKKSSKKQPTLGAFFGNIKARPNSTNREHDTLAHFPDSNVKKFESPTNKTLKVAPFNTDKKEVVPPPTFSAREYVDVDSPADDIDRSTFIEPICSTLHANPPDKVEPPSSVEARTILTPENLVDSKAVLGTLMTDCVGSAFDSSICILPTTAETFDEKSTRLWDETEVNALVKGMKKYAGEKFMWRKIKNDVQFSTVLSKRSLPQMRSKGSRLDSTDGGMNSLESIQDSGLVSVGDNQADTHILKSKGSKIEDLDVQILPDACDWTDAEIASLLAGVQKYANEKHIWQKIMHDVEFKGILSFRTLDQLKEKHNSLSKSQVRKKLNLNVTPFTLSSPQKGYNDEKGKTTPTDISISNGTHKLLTNHKKLSAEMSQSPLSTFSSSLESNLNDKSTNSCTSKLTAISHDDPRIEKYQMRKDELLSKFEQRNLKKDCGHFSIEGLIENLPEEIFKSDSFPDELLPALGCLVQGSHLPLSVLVDTFVSDIKNAKPQLEFISITPLKVSEKIKLIAERKTCGINMDKKSDRFEDMNILSIWRWEIICLDIVPTDKVHLIKPARSDRRKLSLHFKAVMRLLEALNATSKDVAKISFEEEKVLKFEREEEKSRLISEQKEAKLRLQELKNAEKQQKEIEKSEREKSRENERRQRKLEKLQQKEEAVRKKKEEIEKQKEVDRLAVIESTRKKKARMLNYFKTPQKNVMTPENKINEKGNEIIKVCEIKTPSHESENDYIEQADGFNSDCFRRSFDSISCQADLMKEWSKSNIKNKSSSTSRKNGKWRKLSVVVSLPSLEFGQTSYSEHQEVVLYNLKKYLQFREDNRPPYFGTWSKRSRVVSGRRPFRKDTSRHIDYDYDSEAEWEEEEPGEDCNDEKDDDPPDEKEAEYDFQDGWLADDDDFGNSDDNDEDKVLRRPVKEDGDIGCSCIRVVVGPGRGGCPMSVDDIQHGGEHAVQLIGRHSSHIFSSDDICLDLFPRVLNDKITEASSKVAKREVEGETLEIFVKAILMSRAASKAKLVDDFLQANPGPSKSQTMKKLDEIAVKSENTDGPGYIWNVKDSFLSEKGLMHLIEERLNTYNSNCDAVLLPKTKYTQLVGEELKAFVRFIQERNHKSKKALVDAFLSFNPGPSKKHVFEKLDEIATKLEVKGLGYIWDVSDEILLDLNLANLKRVISETVADPKPKKRPLLEMFSALAKKNKTFA
eukprot:CAMPEP_0194271258 /NCGR_PEP_ID=MMETSP0169-20130528/5086_1 /TAXON_ID=218684 /ORGANISM="Corethron pennatum, Strain L29A3" /LENGTH=1287 /DNA_ID=CAMNT_0039013567 /DNA_START=123 /DNA_END=3986 /DNA_ORIENTATION=+